MQCLVPVVLAVLALMVVTVLAQADCKGKVGDFEYDLSLLATRIGDVDLQVTNRFNQVYYYQVCGVMSSSLCQTVTDNMPTVCQKDMNYPTQYHDCGNQKTANFQRLPSGSDSDGFTLAIYGGQENHNTRIHFNWYISCRDELDPLGNSHLPTTATKLWGLACLPSSVRTPP
jgi:hypothetical protein